MTAGHLFEDNEPIDATKFVILRKNIKEKTNYNLKKTELVFIAAKSIKIKRDIDAAILEFDTDNNQKAFKDAGIWPIKPLRLGYDKIQEIGDTVYWIGMAVNDATATPRFFTGQIVSSYTSDSNYDVKRTNGGIIRFNAADINILEINNFFLPGCSGSPILSKSNKKVVGYVHGYGSWPIGLVPGIKIEIPNVEITTDGSTKVAKIKIQPPVIAALSKAFSIKSVMEFIDEVLNNKHIIRESNISINKIELQKILDNLEINYDLSGLSDNTIINSYKIDITDKNDPQLVLTYVENKLK